MAIGQISNGESGSSCRSKLNAAITVIDSAEPVALTYAATISPVFSDGSLRTCTMTGNITTLNVPSGASSGNVWRGVFLASGGARSLTLASGFKTLTGATYSASIASGSIRIIDAYYNGSVWLVIKNQEFAP
jgi:hypothetical protein